MIAIGVGFGDPTPQARCGYGDPAPQKGMETQHYKKKKVTQHYKSIRIYSATFIKYKQKQTVD